MFGFKALFHGGVHPKSHKELASHCAIEVLPLPKRLYVPLHQHAGDPCEPCVEVGQKVLKGEEIGRKVTRVGAPVHAPTSGTVVAIEEHTVGHPSGLTMLCVTLDPDGEDRWTELKGMDNPLSASPEAILDRIRAAGIVGMGGAVYPSFIKLSPAKDKKVDLLLINGSECEPYLTCDDRLMEERGRGIVGGAEIMMHVLGATQCVIGIEDNKPGAIRAMGRAAGPFPGMRVQPLPAMYPQGARQQLVEAITGMQVPAGGRLADIGLTVHNVATAFAVYEAVYFGRPSISRVVTVSGRGVGKPANLECLIGTPIQDLFDYAGGLQPGVSKIVIGGPMMGFTIGNLDVPVVKGTAGVLALLRQETVVEQEQPCIRCGRCVEACPISLVPCEMAWVAKNDQMDAMKDLHLKDCIECGSCSYVCPSHIPLVQYFRYAKLTIEAEKRAKQKFEQDKIRTKLRDERLAREKAEKERQKEATKAAMAERKRTAAAAAAAAPAAAAVPETASVPGTEAAPPAAELSEAESKAARAARAAQAARAAREARAAKQQAGL
ncbi:MAG: electron transport complex subunit RsxC [Magnetococcus sp. MYC-9]